MLAKTYRKNKKISNFKYTTKMCKYRVGTYYIITDNKAKISMNVEFLNQNVFL